MASPGPPLPLPFGLPGGRGPECQSSFERIADFFFFGPFFKDCSFDSGAMYRLFEDFRVVFGMVLYSSSGM